MDEAIGGGRDEAAEKIGSATYIATCNLHRNLHLTSQLAPYIASKRMNDFQQRRDWLRLGCGRRNKPRRYTMTQYVMGVIPQNVLSTWRKI
jgi:hypothetical protein